MNKESPDVWAVVYLLVIVTKFAAHPFPRTPPDGFRSMDNRYTRRNHLASTRCAGRRLFPPKATNTLMTQPIYQQVVRLANLAGAVSSDRVCERWARHSFCGWRSGPPAPW